MSDPGPGPGPRREGDGPAPDSHREGDVPGPAPDRLAEAVVLLARIRRDGQWESSQTHESLLPYLIEESWELVDAVTDDDRDELVSELGDLLLQVLFHAAIGSERSSGAFDVQDVAGALLDKLRRRAPYWFDDDAVDAPASAGFDAAEQDRLWQEAKAAENAGRPPRGVVDGLAWGMPALALGQKVLARARSAGIPDDLVPAEMRTVRLHAEGSAEVAYRGVVRRFADCIRTAEAELPVPAVDATPAHWRAAWPA